MTRNVTQPTSAMYGDGSFGFKSDPPGTTMRLWHCGAYLNLSTGAVDNHRNSSTEKPCMHRTRKDARGCINRKAAFPPLIPKLKRRPK
jgi:hypothetical protein